MIKIDNNIPLPVDEGWGKKLNKLEVGQSVSVLSGSEQTVRQVAWRLFHKEGTKRFRTMVDPIDPKNYRTWRIE